MYPNGVPLAAMSSTSLAIESGEGDYSMCNTSCCRTFLGWLFFYITLIAFSIVLAYAHRILSLLLLGLVPATCILSFLQLRFHKSVLRMQMVLTFLETLLYMIPIVVLENLASYFLIKKQHLPEEGTCSSCILSDFIQAYLIAGLFGMGLGVNRLRDDILALCAVELIFCFLCLPLWQRRQSNTWL